MTDSTVTLSPARALLGQVVAFTGRLASLTRGSAVELVRKHAGTPASTVSRRTTMLVVGVGGWPLMGDGALTRPLRTAEELQRRTGRPAIISEDAFLERLGQRERQRDLRKSYPLAQVSGLTGLPPATIRLWDQLGLVRSSEGRFDFRDVVSLQTIARLLAQGVAAQTICRSIRALAQVLPDAERPLAQLELVVREGGGLAARLGDSLIDTRGQYELDFESPVATSPAPADSPAGAAQADGGAPTPGGVDAPGLVAAALEDETPHVLRIADHLPRTCEDWIEAGLAAEEDERLDDAEEAYRRAIDHAPTSVPAQFNLGTVLLAQGARPAAEERFRQALALDPTFAPAWYNLALTLDDGGRPAEAAEALRKCLKLDPAYAPACFNLAELCERMGAGGGGASRLQAAALWRAFLQLEPEGPWAERARERLGGGGPGPG